MNLDNINFEQLGEKWLGSKIHRMKNLLKIAEPDEAIYREIMLSLGYPKNKVQFLELALLLPFKEIRELKDRETIEQALLYRAGFSEDKNNLPQNFDFSLKMDSSVWDFKGIRPSNYPNKRITGISYLLSESIFDGLVSFFIKRIEKELKDIQTPKEANECVDKIMYFQGIGKQRKKEMFFNIILPFIIAYYKEGFDIVEFLKRLFNIHPPLTENSITRSFIKLLPNNISYSQLNSSIKTYFGIIFYHKEYVK